MYTNFEKIGVICGGLSSERDISLKSGEAVYSALIKEGLDAEKIDLSTEEPEEAGQIIKNSGIETAFVAMHGRFGEDGRLQSILEALCLPYIGSDSLASSLAMNKIISKRIFQEHNIPIPKYFSLNKERKDNIKKEELVFPLVVKPQSQGSSIGVSFADNIDSFGEALDLAFKFDDNIIIEEYIKGRELTVGILDNHALEPIEILPKNKFFDYQAKYTKGLTEFILPAELGRDLKRMMQFLSLKAHKVLGCRHFSRVDLLLDQNNNPYVLEINTIPGFTSTSLLPKAALYEGIAFSQLCIKLITLALRDSRHLQSNFAKNLK